jgi:hypothetical protein
MVIKDLILGLCSLFATGLGFWMARRISAEIRLKRNWPTVPGKILEHGVGEGLGVRTTSYRATVKVRYSVDGKEYLGDQVHLIRRTGAGTGAQIDRLFQSLPDPVPVRYNPQNPSDSYLIVNPIWTAWLLYGVSTVFLFVSLVWVAAAFAGKAPPGPG